jgi:hypothetical protein
MPTSPSATSPVASSVATPVATPAASPVATAVSRRGLLAGAAAATAAVPVLGTGAFTPAAAALPLVTPVWSEKIRRSFGIAVQPQMQQTPYGAVDVWPKYVADLGVTYIRGKFNANLRNNAKLIAQCRALGLKWVMTVIPEDWSMSTTELKRNLADIRDLAPDLCIAIEGMNEPNHNRDGSPLRADWAQATVAYQKVIWDFVHATPALSKVAVVSPSLQLGGDNPYADFAKLGAAGVAQYIDYAGMHSYPGGLKPDSKVEMRLDWVRNAWGPTVPTWVSETGYQNAMNAPMSGPRPVPEDIAASYAPRTVLDYFSKGCKSARYELLDEPDASNTNAEAAYGLLNCPSTNPATWTVKPEYGVLKGFLNGLKDTAASYTPAPVALQVTAPSTVKWILTAKSDGTKTLLAYLNTSIWDVRTRTRIKVNPVDVVVVDRLGTRTVKVGAEVVSIPVR